MMTTDPDNDDFIFVCGGSAKPEDTHLASRVRAVDSEIITFLKRREKRKRPQAELHHHQMEN
jgi:hypothetical protein